MRYIYISTRISFPLPDSFDCKFSSYICKCKGKSTTVSCKLKYHMCRCLTHASDILYSIILHGKEESYGTVYYKNNLLICSAHARVLILIFYFLIFGRYLLHCHKKAKKNIKVDLFCNRVESKYNFCSNNRKAYIFEFGKFMKKILV